MKKISVVSLLFFFLVSCVSKNEPQVTPWGTVVGEEDSEVQEGKNGVYSIEDLQANGEMIVLTLTGPDTYYDYHGHGLGVQYLMCENFARQIGVTLRVELCKDTTEMVNKLLKGEGDVIAVPLSEKVAKSDKLLFCGAKDPRSGNWWAVDNRNKELADTLNTWYKPEMLAQTTKREDYILSVASIRRHVYSPYLNRSRGIVSSYDEYFKRYATLAGVPWQMLAAQCYQESCFDPEAVSWAGACGLMQLMPATASRMGLAKSQIFDPELNIAAGARFMGLLMQKFSDIPDTRQRLCFALAGYNGGLGHIRDAQTLTSKYGGNRNNWADVSQYILRLSDPGYYTDPDVNYGYMRGTETVNYVESILSRSAGY